MLHLHFHSIVFVKVKNLSGSAPTKLFDGAAVHEPFLKANNSHSSDRKDTCAALSIVV